MRLQRFSLPLLDSTVQPFEECGSLLFFIRSILDARDSLTALPDGL